MHVQIQPNCWSCLPTAFAMALDVPYKDILAFCGHDGSEIVFPDDVELGRRAFHAQEMMMFAMYRGVFVTPIEMRPRSVNKYGVLYSLPPQGLYVRDFLGSHSGVIAGRMQGNSHAVAWDGNLIYDPNGTTYEMNDKISIEIFFACNTTRL